MLRSKFGGIIFFISSLVLLYVVNGDDLQTEFNWSTSSVSGYDFEGTLEFCQRGSSDFGYMIGGICSSPGPLFRLSKGKNYLLTFVNSHPNEPSNVHTHGLHISGEGNSDDVTRYANPGCSIQYRWSISADHAEGTNWYHAHKHGHTNTQVSGGALGMIIIEDDLSTLSTPSTDVDDFLTNDKPITIARVNGAWGANGVSNAQISINLNEETRFRILTADPAGTASPLSFPSSCTVRTIAFDGVYRNSVPGPILTSSYSSIGSARTDFSVSCSSLPATISHSNANVITLVDAGGSASSATAGSGWTPRKPSHIGGLENDPIGDTYTISMSAAKINRKSWDPLTPLKQVPYDVTAEWEIKGSGAHPFHLHLFHMQVVSPGGCGQHEEGESYDTISASGSCFVRFRTASLSGRTVLHCHVLAHEDNGAMGWVNVVGTNGIQTTNPSVPETCGCTPDCSLSGFCGSDGCGGTCPCGSGEDCVADQCQPSCIPDCSVSGFCGSDGCGGTCPCGSGEVCVSDQCQTQPSCSPNGDVCSVASDCCSNKCRGGRCR